MPDLVGIALRVSVMYVYALLLLRLSGKTSITALTPLDFIVSLIVGDLFDDVIWAEVPLAQGLVAVTTVALLHTLLSLATWRQAALHDLVCSTPTQVIHAGRLLPRGLAREQTPAAEVMMELRLLGEDKLEAVQQAHWETSGQMSMLKNESARPAQKRDLAALRKIP